MRGVKISVRPFEMISILEFTGLQEMNKHGYMKISGFVEAGKKEEYIRKAAEETWVQILVYDDKDEECNLFCGVLECFRISSQRDGDVLELELYTGTKLMDYKKHFRSFQKEGYTYRQAAELCNKSYSQSGMIMTEGKDSNFPGFVLQYEETDWEFLKRIASLLNSVLVPSCKVQGVKYFFGIPEKKSKLELDTESYTTRQDIGEYAYKHAEGMELGRKDAVCYIVESMEICDLGDQISFLGMELYVFKIETSWKGNELYFRYYLKTKKGLCVPVSYHKEIIGLSLFGTVEDVQGEQVKISIQNDENGQSGNRWFAFSTVYSSPDGAGWYCMPEIGDTIRLYCPAEDESQAYVTSAVHENQGNGLRINPDHKIWRNKEGKEIRLTPNKILITNNHGMSVELSDKQGIKISSDGSVTIHAADRINISSANGALELSASNRIVLKQGNTTMKMAEGISFNGAKINLQ